jgi:hypothetical protein
MREQNKSRPKVNNVGRLPSEFKRKALAIASALLISETYRRYADAQPKMASSKIPSNAILMR